MTTVPDSLHRTGPATGRLRGARALFGAVILLVALPAWSDDAAERWRQISTSLFGDRPVLDGRELISLETPYRALDAAVVPVNVRLLSGQTLERYVEALYLVIDMNPSPVAAVFRFPGPRAWTTLSTRVRVNAYSHVRAIAQTSDGKLYMAANFVKASGGCSAPSLKDPAAAAAQLGRMKLRLPAEIAAGDALVAQLMIKHPNSSGLQFDQVSRNYIPADFVRTIRVGYGGEPLFTVDADISISEDPSIHFDFVPAGPGSLDVEVTDSSGRTFRRGFEVAADGGG